jgi:exodeoxyribonuclease VII small subunit
MTETPDEMTFEEAFAELEQVVTQLEGGSLTLEDSLTLFERGQTLAAACRQKLDQAELKVEQITSEGDA